MVPKTASATHSVCQPNAHQIISTIPKMNTGSMAVRMRSWVSEAGARLASVVPRMFHTGVPL